MKNIYLLLAILTAFTASSQVVIVNGGTPIGNTDSQQLSLQGTLLQLENSASVNLDVLGDNIEALTQAQFDALTAPQQAAYTGIIVDAESNTVVYILNTISGRTGTTITAIMEQTQAQYDTDGAPSSGQYVIVSDPPPAGSWTGTAIPLDGYYQRDDTSTDTATWTLGTSKKGGSAEININSTIEPTVTGATQVTGTTAWVTGTLMVLTVKNFSGTVKYWFTELFLWWILLFMFGKIKVRR